MNIRIYIRTYTHIYLNMYYKDFKIKIHGKIDATTFANQTDDEK